MRDPPIHFGQAEKNEEFVDDILDDYSDYTDWAVTGQFYAAVHYVDTILSDNNVQVKNHNERKREMKARREISKIAWSNYKSLKDYSEETRYQCSTPTQGRLTSADTALTNLKDELPLSKFED